MHTCWDVCFPLRVFGNIRIYDLIHVQPDRILAYLAYLNYLGYLACLTYLDYLAYLAYLAYIAYVAYFSLATSA